MAFVSRGFFATRVRAYQAVNCHDDSILSTENSRWKITIENIAPRSLYDTKNILPALGVQCVLYRTPYLRIPDYYELLSIRNECENTFHINNMARAGALNSCSKRASGNNSS